MCGKFAAIRVHSRAFAVENFLDGDRSFDARMGIVVFKGNVLEAEAIDGFYVRIDVEGWEGARLAGELEFCLLEVVLVKVKIAEGVDELADFIIANLGDEMGEQSV